MELDIDSIFDPVEQKTFIYIKPKGSTKRIGILAHSPLGLNVIMWDRFAFEQIRTWDVIAKVLRCVVKESTDENLTVDDTLILVL